MYSLKNLTSFLNSIKEKGYPWASTVVDVSTYISSFLKYVPKVEKVEKVENRKLSAYFPKFDYFLPLFLIVVKSSFNDLVTIDGLTDFWTERVRLSTRKNEEVKSPLEILQNIENVESFDGGDGGDSVDVKETLASVYHSLRKKFPHTDECSAIYIRQYFSFATHEARNFRLSWIKGILSAIAPIEEWKGKRWLDISTGYGDRLLAAGLLEMEYQGFDPNTNLIDPINQMIEFLEKRNPKLKGKLKHECLPFEDTEDIRGKFDLILSSPPFFKAEIYSNEETQSIQRYGSFELWMKEFLFRSIEIAWRYLRVGGFLVLYVGDPRSNDGKSIAEPMNLFIETLPNSSYFAVLGIENDIGIIRPCWIWSKVTVPSERKFWKPEIVRSLSMAYPELLSENEI